MRGMEEWGKRVGGGEQKKIIRTCHLKEKLKLSVDLIKSKFHVIAVSQGFLGFSLKIIIERLDFCLLHHAQCISAQDNWNGDTSVTF